MRRLDRGVELRLLAIDLRDEVLRRRPFGLDAERRQLRDIGRILSRRDDMQCELVDDLFGRPGWNEKAVPAFSDVPGKVSFKVGTWGSCCIRRGVATARRSLSRSLPAAPDRRHCRRTCRSALPTAPPSPASCRGRGCAPRRTRRERRRVRRQMRHRAHAARSVIDLAGLGVGNEFGNRPGGNGRAYPKNERSRAENTDRSKISFRIVVHLLQPRHDGDLRRSREEQRVAIGCGLRHVGGGNRPTRANPILDDKALPEIFGNPFPGHARHHVRVATGSVSHHHGDSPVRPIRRLRMGRAGPKQCKQSQRGGEGIAPRRSARSNRRMLRWCCRPDH